MVLAIARANLPATEIPTSQVESELAGQDIGDASHLVASNDIDWYRKRIIDADAKYDQFIAGRATLEEAFNAAMDACKAPPEVHKISPCLGYVALIGPAAVVEVVDRDNIVRTERAIKTVAKYTVDSTGSTELDIHKAMDLKQYPDSDIESMVFLRKGKLKVPRLPLLTERPVLLTVSAEYNLPGRDEKTRRDAEVALQRLQEGEVVCLRKLRGFEVRFQRPRRKPGYAYA